MRQITQAELHQLGVAALGLDPTVLDLCSVECIANCLRRAAGFMCPCPPRSLIDAVMQPLDRVIQNPEELRQSVEEILDAMVAYGDFVECRTTRPDELPMSTILLFATPPTFVPLHDGGAFLLGITPDHVSALPDSVSRRIEYVNYLRRIEPENGENLRVELSQLGLIELHVNHWLKTPQPMPAEPYVYKFDIALENAGPPGQIQKLRILDGSKSQLYYRGRWVEPRFHTGRYVARRPQSYGADLWCYTEIERGELKRLVDLPIFETRWRACDEAWRLQAARDSLSGTPQQYRTCRGPAKDTTLLQLFSPIPLWLQRRWEAIGQPALASGCLLAYTLPDRRLTEELKFANEHFWLNDVERRG